MKTLFGKILERLGLNLPELNGFHDPLRPEKGGPMALTEQDLDAAAEILAKAQNVCVSSGSGVSAESGISTFRDPGGLWSQIDPMEAGTVEGLLNTLNNKAHVLMPIFEKLLDAFLNADPNPGHRALADLERMGLALTIVTQNVDNLHQEAGSGQVVEIHGNLFRMACLQCGQVVAHDRKTLVAQVRKRFRALTSFTLEGLLDLGPRCPACGFLTRPDVVMFGEAVKDLPRAFEAAGACDVLMAIGTSGVVYPAAELPRQARRAGARIIVVNPMENAFSKVSHIYLPGPTGQVLPELAARVKRIKG